jgi:hypothetical protein
MKCKENDYFHLISDADVLTRNIAEFRTFFEENKGKNYIEFQTFPSDDFTHESYKKLLYYHRLEKYNIRQNNFDNEQYTRELKEQEQEQHYRTLPDVPIYGGPAWWSLTRECVSYLLKKTDFIETYFKDTLFPDECFAQTIILNSPYANTCVNKNLRFICWEFRNGNRPAVLDREDLSSILQEECFFARKIDPSVSSDLILSLDNIFSNNAITDAECSIQRLCTTFCNRIQEGLYNGLLYGNPGILLFFAFCHKYTPTEVHKDILPKEEIVRLITMEFFNTKDSSFATGKLGLSIALEILNFLNFSPYQKDVEKDVESLNADVVTYVLNCSESDFKREEYFIYDAYFRARRYGNHLSDLDAATWDMLKTKMKNLDLHPLLRPQNGSIGITGCGLYGMRLLSTKYGLDSSLWEYLIYC